MKTRAQSVVEYVALICLLVGALVAVQMYLKRGIQGRIKSTSEQVGSGIIYAPGETTSYISYNRIVNSSSNSYSIDQGDEGSQSISEGSTNAAQRINRSENIIVR
jgi:hypothetical protein